MLSYNTEEQPSISITAFFKRFFPVLPLEDSSTSARNVKQFSTKQPQPRCLTPTLIKFPGSASKFGQSDYGSRGPNSCEMPAGIKPARTRLLVMQFADGLQLSTGCSGKLRWSISWSLKTPVCAAILRGLAKSQLHGLCWAYLLNARLYELKLNKQVASSLDFVVTLGEMIPNGFIFRVACLHVRLICCQGERW